MRQFDKRLILDPRTAGAGDDIQGCPGGGDDRTHAPGGDLGQNLPADDNLLGLLRVRHCQGNTNRIADPAADQLLESNPRLDDAVRRDSRLGNPQV